MPRLEGVKVLDMKDGEVTRIEYDGEEYVNVGKEGGQAGDIGLRVRVDCAYAKVGEYYPITKKGSGIGFKADSSLVPYVIEDLGNFVYFRKTEKAVQTERKPKPGDKIRIVNAYHVTGGQYKNGDILTVKKYIRGNEIINERVIVEEFEAPTVFLDEFEFVDVSELKPQFKMGDFAKVVGETYWSDIKKGTIVKITDEANEKEDYICFETLDGNDFDYAKAESLEKINPTNQELSFYRAGRNLGELKVGDIVRSIQHTGAHDKGVIVEITGGGERYKFGDIDVYLAEWEYFELVAPVENRTDIERSESDE